MTFLRTYIFTPYMGLFYSFWSYFNSESGVNILGTGYLPFWGYFNSSISGVIFTPQKDFFKLLFGVKITPQKITPLLGVKLTPLEELKLLENYCVHMAELSYVLTKDFVSCVHFPFYFFQCRPFSPRWPLAFLIFSPPLWNFHFFLITKFVSFVLDHSLLLFLCYQRECEHQK